MVPAEHHFASQGILQNIMPLTADSKTPWGQEAPDEWTTSAPGKGEKKKQKKT
jgi:hypothetical protein